MSNSGNNVIIHTNTYMCMALCLTRPHYDVEPVSIMGPTTTIHKPHYILRGPRVGAYISLTCIGGALCPNGTGTNASSFTPEGTILLLYTLFIALSRVHAATSRVSILLCRNIMVRVTRNDQNPDLNAITINESSVSASLKTNIMISIMMNVIIKAVYTGLLTVVNTMGARRNASLDALITSPISKGMIYI